MPVFCIDFLFKNNYEYLLLKRKQEPLKNYYWVPGGRLLINESIDNCAYRIQKREIGHYFSNYELIGFSNYFFKKTINSRALHTPTLLFEINIENKFIPSLDKTHSEYLWTKKLPRELTTNLIKFRHN